MPRDSYTTAMRTFTAIAISFLAVTACHVAPPVKVGGPATQAAHRVVLLSLDGLAAVRHRELLRQGAYRDPAGLAAFESGGYVVERALPAEPTLTAVSHASIATGAFPAATGIVSNRFHLPGTPITQGVSGFDLPWGAESLWQAFRRQGKRVGVLTFPGCDNTIPSRTADFGMVYINVPFARSQEVSLSGGEFSATTLPAGWSSFSPARRATLTVTLTGASLPQTASFTLTALDTTDDGKIDYDTLVVDDDGDLSNGVIARVHAGEWFPLRLRAPHPDGGTRTVGGWCLLQALPADLAAVRIYRGAFFATEAYPREFREALDAATGFWPGPGDEQALARSEEGREGLRVGEYMAQTRRFSEFFTACAKTTVARERFDLLMLYQPIPDEVEHQLLLVDPRQKAFSKASSTAALAAVKETFLIADHAVGELARTIDLSSDALVVVSDHGMAPVWENIHVNQLLQQAGLAQAEQVGGKWRVTAGSQIAAYSAGGSSHLYLNLKGREPGGVVEPSKADEVIETAAAALARLQVDGENVVEAMYRKSELAPLGLDSRNAGDLVVFLHPGFAATSLIGAPAAPAHEPADYYGQHGYRNTHPEVAAVWLARGAAVPPRHLAQASLTEVASFVAHLAGVQPPTNARPWSR
jgi:predicted AlkP superfamily phosphohydrolase/phosphomutase